MVRRSHSALIAACLGLLLAGCESKGSSSGPAKGSPGSTAAVSTGAKKPAPAGTSASAGPVNGCSSFDDHTDVNAEHTIDWDESVAKSAKRCMKIKAGQTVTWQGDFKKYPIQPSGGDSPTPIAQLTENISNPGVKGEERTNVEFKKPGTFGFASPKSSLMKGAILVVP